MQGPATQGQLAHQLGMAARQKWLPDTCASQYSWKRLLQFPPTHRPLSASPPRGDLYISWERGRDTFDRLLIDADHFINKCAS